MVSLQRSTLRLRITTTTITTAATTVVSAATVQLLLRTMIVVELCLARMTTREAARMLRTACGSSVLHRRLLRCGPHHRLLAAHPKPQHPEIRDCLDLPSRDKSWAVNSTPAIIPLILVIRRLCLEKHTPRRRTGQFVDSVKISRVSTKHLPRVLNLEIDPPLQANSVRS